MFRYRAYGLSIASEMELPELSLDSPAESAAEKPTADLNVRLAQIAHERPPDAVGGPPSWARRGEVLLEFEDGGRFLIREGREITIDRAPLAQDIAVRLFLLGPVLGTALHQRGLLVLHASAVEIDGVAVGFLAEKGTGKSTLAAAFHAHGHMLVADDIVPVDVDAPAGPIAYPGFPQLKLFPEAAAQLGGGSDDLPRLLPGYDKRARRLDTPFSDRPLRLGGLYVLVDGETETIEPLPPQQIFLSLLRHTFTLPLLRATGSDSDHFRQATELGRRLPARSLMRRRSLATLPEVVRMVEADLRTAGHSS